MKLDVIARILIVVAGLSCRSIYADDAVVSEPAGGIAGRPRIGLALAGGGARGIGHIGVIRLLEELNVPVDYVAGTSMGSIVGGLYSAGYTADEMEQWVRECDWDVMLSDSPPRRERGFRAKQEEIETPRWTEFGISSKGLSVPEAFVTGQNLLFALRQKTGWVGRLSSFDELPVPFRAVATDVETGAMVVLDHGVLADAMRASMAVPGVFAPHAIDGRVLMDGFASRNLPISVVRDMGADIIIAVDVRGDLKKADELGNPVAMVNQLLGILSQRDTLEQVATLDESDILVHLKLPGYSQSSFREGLKLVALGYDEAQPAREALARLSVPPGEYATYRRERRLERHDNPVIVRIDVEGTGRVSPEAVKSRLDVVTGEPLDRERLEDSIREVYDLGYFQVVDYRVEDRPEGKTLVVSTREKPWGPNFAIFGLSLGSDVGGDTEFNLKTSMRFTQINRYGGELALRGSLGTIDRLQAEFYQPAGYSGTFFMAARAEYLRQPERYRLDADTAIPGLGIVPIDFKRQTVFGDVDLGMRLGASAEARVGVGRGSVDYSDVRAPSIVIVDPINGVEVVRLADVFEKYTTTRITGSLTVDRLDNAFFPTRGLYLHVAGDWESSASGSSAASLFGTMPVSFRDGALAVQPFASIGYTLEDSEDSGRLPFRVGGLFNLSGLPVDEVFGANSLVTGVVLRKRLSAPGSLATLYVGGSLEAGNAWYDNNDRLPSEWIVAGSAFLAADTPIGPLHLAVGAAEGNNYAVYLYLGRIRP